MLLPILAHAGDSAGGGGFPPIHPILVNFTAALIPTSVAADLLGRWLKRPSLRSTGWWTICMAAVITPLTALVGWLWMRSMEDMDHWQMRYHLWLGVSIAALLIPLAVWRAWIQRKDRPVGIAYFVAASLLTGALSLQGELGGSMSFGHTLLFSGDDAHSSHNSSHADHSANEGSEAMPQMDHHDHGSTGKTPLRDGWKDHIDFNAAPTTKP